MKRAYLVCLFQFLTVTFLLSQVDPVPTVDRIVNRSSTATSPGISSRVSASQTDPKAQARILENYGKLPLSFEANHGQADSRVKFLSRTGAYTLFLTGDEAVMALSGRAAKKSSPQGLKPASLETSGTGSESGRSAGGVLRMKLRNANPAQPRLVASMNWRGRVTTSLGAIRRSGGRMFRLCEGEVRGNLFGH
jgi:hypothetical protein